MHDNNQRYLIYIYLLTLFTFCFEINTIDWLISAARQLVGSTDFIKDLTKEVVAVLRFMHPSAHVYIMTVLFSD